MILLSVPEGFEFVLVGALIIAAFGAVVFIVERIYSFIKFIGNKINERKNVYKPWKRKK